MVLFRAHSRGKILHFPRYREFFFLWLCNVLSTTALWPVFPCGFFNNKVPRVPRNPYSYQILLYAFLLTKLITDIFFLLSGVLSKHGSMQLFRQDSHSTPLHYSNTCWALCWSCFSKVERKNQQILSLVSWCWSWQVNQWFIFLDIHLHISYIIEKHSVIEICYACRLHRRKRMKALL